LPALWVGLLYDKESQSDAYNLAKPLMESSILEKGRISAATFALNGKIGDFSIQELASKMLKISNAGLQRRNRLDARGIDERQFLDPLFYILDNKETGAEKLLQKYNNSWNKNIDRIFIENLF